MKKTVTILLSTYNGEKYLEEQLQSLFNQTYWENCTLFVRDDGSKDGTIEILKKYEKENKLILNCGENIGFVKSFFWLLNNAPKADFYSFCDQDDVWFEDKIERAVSMLSEKDLNNPQLYFSDYDFYSSNLKFISTRSTSKKTPSFYEALTDCRAAGFTILINTPFLDELKKINSNNIFYHDYLMYLLSFCITFPIYDRTSTAKYRRHETNESISIKEKKKLLFWRIKNFLLKSDTKFSDTYQEILNSEIKIPSEYKKNLLLFSTKKTFFVQLKKLFFPHRLRQKIFDEICLRILFILGRL